MYVTEFSIPPVVALKGYRKDQVISHKLLQNSPGSVINKFKDLSIQNQALHLRYSWYESIYGQNIIRWDRSTLS